MSPLFSPFIETFRFRLKLFILPESPEILPFYSIFNLVPPVPQHPSIESVYWPGFPSHPQHDIAREQMKDFGAMSSFVPKNGDNTMATQILSRLELFTLAESLGGVESLAGHPASMTHAAIPKDQREAQGVVGGLIRLSVGIEDVKDLMADLDQAIA